MSLPPVKWEHVQPNRTTALGRLKRPVTDLLMAMAWGARNEGVLERFQAPIEHVPLEPVFYQTEDGWTAPLWRYPAQPGSTGEPIILASSLGLHHTAFDIHPDRSLVKHLHRCGFDVFLFTHRGSEDAVQPLGAVTFDFDDIVAHDIPAALATVKAVTGAKRVGWVGHGFGGQLLVGHLATSHLDDISAAVTICAPVVFQKLGTVARRAAAVANMMPEHWRLPVRTVQSILTLTARPGDLARRTLRMEGPMARSLLINCSEDLAVGLVKQVSRWHEVGHMVDRNNRFDYLGGIQGNRTPLLCLAAEDDEVCPPADTRPIVDALADGAGEWRTLEGGWGHLDPVAGADAPRVVFPHLSTWLAGHHNRCW